MESEELLRQISSFLRANILFVGLLFIAVVFIMIGIWQVQAMNADNSVQIIKAENEPASGVEETIVVDVSGAVLKPGVYSFERNARISHALQKAGGLSDQADSSYIEKSLNLAQKLNDGMKIYIPRTGEQPVLSSTVHTNTADVSVNINTASASELDALSGIGPVTAQKIIDNRPYKSVEELVEKKVVSQSVFEKNKSRLSF